jgi:stage III sporulation protein AD
MSVLKIAAIAVCGVLLAIILKNAKSELSILISLAVSVIIIFYIAAKMSGIISELGQLEKFISISKEYIEILIKVIGITYVTQFATDICRDNGYAAIAGQIEIFCKITIAAISLPIVLSLFQTVTKCIG